MADQNKNSRSRWLWQVPIAIAILGTVLLAFAAWYLNSSHFNQYVRNRVVARLEQITGGRVELKSLRWNLSRLEFDITDLTVHGNEPPGTTPYIHVDHAFVRLRIGYVFRPDPALRLLRVDRPAIHIILNPDGSTSQPAPKLRTSAAAENIFKFRIDRADIRDGELVLNDRRTPLDFSANEIAADLTYLRGEKRYVGSISAGKIDARLWDFRPFGATAEAQFSVSQNLARITGFKIRSGSSELEATGELTDFREPKFMGNYEARLDLAELAPVVRNAEIRQGTLIVCGRGVWNSAQAASTGKLQLQNFEYRNPTLLVAGAEAAADFSVNNDRLTVSNIVGKLWGGNVAGELALINWPGRGGASIEAPEVPKVSTGKRVIRPRQPRPEWEGVARLKLHGLRVADLAAAFASKSMPLHGLKLAGTADGKLDSTWRAAPGTMVTAMDLQVAPPATVLPGQNPVTARLRAVYHSAGQKLDIAELNLSTRATRLEATGSMGTSATKLNINLNTTDANEFSPVLKAQGLTPMPVEVHGRASFTGTVTGGLAAPAIVGHLQLNDFESLLAVSTPESPPRKRKSQFVRQISTVPSAAPLGSIGTRRMHWDQLIADIEYSPQVIAARNAVLRRGSAQVNFDFSANRSKAQFSNAPFTAKVHIRNAQIADVQSLIGFEYPVSGTLNANMRLSGTLADPRGDGNVRVTDANLYGEAVQLLNAYLHFGSHEAQLTDIELAQNGSRITGAAAYNFASSAFRFDLRGTRLNLANIQRVQSPRFVVAGIMDFKAQGSGTKQAPALNLSFQLRNLVLNGERAGDVEAEAVTIGEIMRVAARSRNGASDLDVNGTVRLRDDYWAELMGRFSDLDIDPVLRAFVAGRITGHSQSTGTVALHGPLARPRDLTASADITRMSLNVENIGIRNDGAVRFSVAQNALRLERSRWLGDNTDLVASGTLQLSGTRALDVTANGHVNLKLLQSYDPNIVSYGTVTMNVTLGGTIVRPAVEGQVEIANAGLSYVDLPMGLSDIMGTLVFNRDRLTIQTLTARSGGGALDISGYLAFTPAGRLRWNLKAHGRDIRLRYPPGVSAVANADLQFQGTSSNSLLSGDVVVTRFGVNPRFDFALYLARAKQTPEAPNPKSPLNNVRLDVHVVSTPELQVQTSLAKLFGTADLRLRGTAMRPVLLGRTTIIEGDIIINGTKYRLERGEITFNNPTRIEPVLDMQATTRMRDYDITVGFHGRADRLSYSYRSDPPLPTADIIALLAFGRTREETAVQTATSQNFNQTASQAILSQALSAAMGSRVQRLFGVSRIKIDPQMGGAENNPSGARVTVEQQVANKLTITYITDLARANQQIVQTEYNINRNLSLVGIRDQNGVISFDIRFRQRKR
ncbi:MAG: translocation/assembly module TamB domain-containing protein [Terriglobales bacterium]